VKKDITLYKKGGIYMAFSAIAKTGNLLLDPLYRLWFDIIAILPSIVLALLIAILGYAVAYFIGYIIRHGLEKLVGKQFREATLSKQMGPTNIPSLTGELVKWFVFIVFLEVAVDVLNLSTLSQLLDTFVRWLPNVLFAVIIFFTGVALAHYIDIKIREHTKMKGMMVISGILKTIVLFLVVLIGLKQIGVNVDVLQHSFLILLGALGLGVALALGIGLGLGLRNEAEDIVSKLKKNI